MNIHDELRCEFVVQLTLRRSDFHYVAVFHQMGLKSGIYMCLLLIDIFLAIRRF